MDHLFQPPVRCSDGRLIGIVLSTIFSDYFEQFFARTENDVDRSFTLHRSDGMLLVRYPHADTKIGAMFNRPKITIACLRLRLTASRG